MAGSVSRRDFARLFAVGGSAALFADPVWARTTPQAPAFAPGNGATSEAFWKTVREQFVMPPDLGVLNAANLCPASRPVLEALKRESDSVDRDPSGQNRARLSGEKENTRKALAEFLRVTPEEIVITRNTSEANNMVSSGIDLKPGDEVVVFHDNHPSNLVAWQEKAKRWGFTVVEIPVADVERAAKFYARLGWRQDATPPEVHFESSSVATASKKKPAFDPPYFSSYFRPNSPSSAAWPYSARGNSSAASHS